MTGLQQDPPRKLNGGESVEPSREVVEATDEELSAAIAGIELADDVHSGSNLPSTDDGSDAPLLDIADDESDPACELKDESDRSLDLETDESDLTLDFETDESDQMLDIADDEPDRTLDLNEVSDDSSHRDTATDASTDTPPGGLRALLARLL